MGIGYVLDGDKMIVLKNGTFDGMSEEIKTTDSKLIIFGIGVIGSTITPEILKKYHLEDRILFCVDNDSTRWNTYLNICGKELKIVSPETIINIEQKITVLITISRYKSAIEQLELISAEKTISCYIIPALCIRSYSAKGGKGAIKYSDKKLIPKKIHYMWLGKKPIPENLLRCIDSWRKYCPDYEIIRWDESNYDVHKNIFMAQAYDNRKFGFVPDYARIELLYEHGGIYLDTDVELIRNIDELLYQEAFCGVEKWQVLNFGGCSGAVKGHYSLKPFLDRWSERRLIRSDGTLDGISSGLIDTSVAIEHGYEINGRTQIVNGMTIYTYDYFHPYDYMTGKINMTDDTFSVHHFNGGWLDEKSKTESKDITKAFDNMMENAVEVG